MCNYNNYFASDITQIRDALTWPELVCAFMDAIVHARSLESAIGESVEEEQMVAVCSAATAIIKSASNAANQYGTSSGLIMHDRGDDNIDPVLLSLDELLPPEFKREVIAALTTSVIGTLAAVILPRHAAMNLDPNMAGGVALFVSASIRPEYILLVPPKIAPFLDRIADGIESNLYELDASVRVHFKPAKIKVAYLKFACEIAELRRAAALLRAVASPASTAQAPIDKTRRLTAQIEYFTHRPNSQLPADMLQISDGVTLADIKQQVDIGLVFRSIALQPEMYCVVMGDVLQLIQLPQGGHWYLPTIAHSEDEFEREHRVMWMTTLLDPRIVLADSFATKTVFDWRRVVDRIHRRSDRARLADRILRNLATGARASDDAIVPQFRWDIACVALLVALDAAQQINWNLETAVLIQAMNTWQNHVREQLRREIRASGSTIGEFLDGIADRVSAPLVTSECGAVNGFVRTVLDDESRATDSTPI